MKPPSPPLRIISLVLFGVHQVPPPNLNLWPVFSIRSFVALILLCPSFSYWGKDQSLFLRFFVSGAGLRFPSFDLSSLSFLRFFFSDAGQSLSY